MNKLGLGTVQWGMRYGLANHNGVTSPEAVTAILNEAKHHGISALDTASLYGESESVLGQNSLMGFRVITKTPSFSTDQISEIDANKLITVFMRSLNLLNCEKIYGLMIHHAENLLVTGGEKLLWAMMTLKDRGLVEKIGVSVYDGMQVDAVLDKFTPDLIQLPFSVLDQRLLLSGHLQHLKNNGVEIHARSVFLQGLLLIPLDKIPKYFDPIRPLLTHVHKSAEEQGLTVNQAVLSFVKNNPYIDTVLVGVDNLIQLRSCVNDFMVKESFDASGLACSDPLFVNPSLWRLS